MPILSIRCSNCGSHFVDSRVAATAEDVVTCPSCGFRRELTGDFVESVEVEPPPTDFNAAAYER